MFSEKCAKYSPKRTEKCRNLEVGGELENFPNGPLCLFVRSSLVKHDARSPERDVSSLAPRRHRQGLHRKKSGRSRLQIVTTGDNEANDEMYLRVVVVAPDSQGVTRDMNARITPTSLVSSSFVGVFSHSMPIICLLTGLLGCSSTIAQKFCVEDSSITVLQR